MCNFGQKQKTSISRKICCLNSGFQILYAVDQFSSPFSKDKLKQGTHIHQTHDPPWSPWSAFPHVVGELQCGSQPTSPTCVVWSWHLKDSPRQESVFYTRLFPRLASRNSTCLGLDSRPCVLLRLSRRVCFLVDTGSYLFVVLEYFSYLVV